MKVPNKNKFSYVTIASPSFLFVGGFPLHREGGAAFHVTTFHNKHSILKYFASINL